MIDIRTAFASDLPKLKAVWHDVFGDEESYLDFFFVRRFDPDNTLVLTVDGDICSQLFLLPCKVRSGETLYDSYYLFAAATLAEYRGRGFMAKLLNAAEHLAKDRGKDAIVLMTAEDSLNYYYARFSYRPVFTRRVLDCTRRELQSFANAFEATTDSVGFLQRYMAHTDGLVWDADAIEYALCEHGAFRGTYETVDDAAFIALEQERQTVICTFSEFGKAASFLLQKTNLTDYHIILPPDVPFGNPQRGGMLLDINHRIRLQDAFLCFAME